MLLVKVWVPAMLLLLPLMVLAGEKEGRKSTLHSAAVTVQQTLGARQVLVRLTNDSLAGNLWIAQDSLHRFRDSLVALPDTVIDSTIRERVTLAARGMDSTLMELEHSLVDAVESLAIQRLDIPLKGLERLDPETSADSAKDLLEGLADTLTDLRGDGKDALLGRLSELRDSLESLTDSGIEAKDRADSVRDVQDSLDDLLRTQGDSLQELRDSLVERANDSLDRRFEKATRLGLSSDMASRYPWHGRDDGKVRLAWTPEFAFHHESGLSVNAAFTALTVANATFADWTVGGDYDWSRFDWFHLDLAYAYESVTRDSEQVPAMHIHDLSLEGGVSIPFEGIGLPATSLELSLRGAVEQSGESRDYLVTTTLGMERELWKATGRKKIALEPRWVLETGTLEVDRTRTVQVGTGKKKVATEVDYTSSIFMELDWDACLPAHLYWGGLEAAPAIHWIKPLHSQPGERAAGYIYLELPMSVSLPL